MVKQISSVFILLVGLVVNSFSQTVTIVSAEDSQTIPSVRIDVKAAEQIHHFRTDAKGEWILPSSFKSTSFQLTISSPGYATLTLPKITIAKDTTVVLLTDVQQFAEVAVTAQYKSQLVENAVHDIKVIDAGRIEAMAAQNLKEALSYELNIHLTEDNILGSGLQIQGIGGENVKILIDGMPITGRQNGNIDLSQILMDNVERIEIVEGPLSVSYGTDALAGTINIITKKNQSKAFELISNNYFESSGKANNNLSLGWRLGKHQIRAEGGRHYFDGWDPSHSAFHFKKPIADSSRMLLWKPKTQYFAGLNYRYNRKNTYLNYSGEFYHEDIINRGYPQQPFYESAMDDYYQTMRSNQRVNFDYRLKNSYRISVLAGYSGYFRRKNTKVRDLTSITDVFSNDPNNHDTSSFHSFTARGRWVQSSEDKKINYEVGFDILYEIATGGKILNERQDIGDYAAYVTAEYSPIKEVTIRPGLRYGHNTKYQNPLTPSLNIRYKFLEREKQNLTLRASYARGYRSPSIKELYYRFVDINHDIVGNENLKAERSHNFNLSLHQNLSLERIRMNNKVVLFYNDIRDMITLAQASPTQFSYYNLNRFASTGARLESNLNYKEISVGLGIGVIGRYNELQNNTEFDFDQLNFAPEINTNVRYDWKKQGIQVALFYKYNGELPQVVSNELGEFSLATIKDYHLADVKISKYIWNNRLQISMGVKNIFNVINVEGSEGNAIEAHSSNSGVVSVGTGRTYNLGIKLNLKSKK